MGWLVTIFLAFSLQYGGQRRRNLWLHRSLGFLIFLGATWHTVRSMHPGLKVINTVGLYIASIGWLLLGAQIAVGLALGGASAAARNGLRKLHFLIMVVVTASIFVHILLNAH